MVSAVVVLEKTLGSVWPGIAIERFGDGFKLFFDVQLPFVPAFHPKMHGLVLLGVVGFTLAVTLAVAARRPLLAGGLLVAGAGWPTTLLHGERPLRDGAIILGAVLLIVAGIGSAVRARQAAVAGALVIGAAVGHARCPPSRKARSSRGRSGTPTRPSGRSASATWDTTYR